MKGAVAAGSTSDVGGTKTVLWCPSTHKLAQHPYLHPLEWVLRGHEGRQKHRQSKNDKKLHKVRLSHSDPHKPCGVGTRKHFFRLKIEKPTRCMIFDSKKGGGVSTFFERPPPPNPSLKKQKMGFKWGGSGWVRPKNSLGDVFIGQRQFNPLR